MPASVAICSAISLVIIQPVQNLEPFPPAISNNPSVISSTTGIILASSFSLGLSSYNPSISVNINNASALTNLATMAERLSLSPYTISSTATASFSLIIGIAPYSNVFSNAFIKLS